MSTNGQSPDITIFAEPQNGCRRRLVVAMNGENELFRDTIDTDADDERRRYQRRLCEIVEIPDQDLASLSTDIVAAADDADQRAAQLGSQTSARGPSQASSLVSLADDIELFHDSDGEPFATVERDGHFETLHLRRKEFKDLMCRRYYLSHGQVPNSQAWSDALNVLSGRAQHEGEEQQVHVRCGRGPDGQICIDLGDATWRTVEITAAGWLVVPRSRIKFVRSKGMQSLPEPARGQSLCSLREFLNVSDDLWPLVAAWLVAAVRPEGPYPLCVFGGEQGTAKSTATRILKKLVDPNRADLRPPPRDGRDLAIAASNSWVLCFDNLSWIKDWLSDTLCRLSTGGAFATRQLYSDADEVLFESKRPVILNAIEELGGRGDLLDRSMLITLQRIPDADRRTESAFWSSFDQTYARLLGGLYDAVSLAMRNLPNVALEQHPRMADFAEWAVAAEPAFGVEDGAFLRSYGENRQSAHELAIEGSHVARAMRILIQRRPGWSGTATELLAALNTCIYDRNVTRQSSWPKNARAVSSALRRLAPNLRETGIDVNFHRSGTRGVLVHRNHNWVDPTPSFPVPPAPTTSIENETELDSPDANDANDASIGG